MINSTYQFVTDFFKDHTGFKNMLDVGARDVSSGHIRNHVPRDIQYTGADMIAGDNVDVVVNTHELLTKFAPGSFDVVTCFDTFEHDETFWISWEQMKQVVKKDGWILLGFPGRLCPLHEHPADYWRFMPGSIDYFFKDFADVYTRVIKQNDWNQEVENEIYAWGRKK